MSPLCKSRRWRDGGKTVRTSPLAGCFMARNQSDFIHKRLKEALSGPRYLSQDGSAGCRSLLAGANQQTDLLWRVMKVARIVREVGGHIINFLAALEDFQKALWERKSWC